MHHVCIVFSNFSCIENAALGCSGRMRATWRSVLDGDVLQVHDQTGSLYFARHKHKSQHDLLSSGETPWGYDIDMGMIYKQPLQNLTLFLSVRRVHNVQIDIGWYWYTLIIFDQHVVCFRRSCCFRNFNLFRPPRPPCRRSRPVASGRCQNPSATSLARARRLTQRRGTVSPGHDFHLWQFALETQRSPRNIRNPHWSTFSILFFMSSMISPYVSTLKLSKARNTNAGRMARSRPTKYAKPCLNRLYIWSRLPR